MGKNKINNDLNARCASFVNLNNNEMVAKYVKDIMRYKPLKANEEIELFKQFHSESDEAKKGKIREEIINRNLRFVYSVAKRYSQEDELLMDLIQVGTIGLIAAFDDYDYTTGNRFCTLAVNLIRQQISKFMDCENSLIKKSNVRKINPKLPVIQNKFFVENGRMPDVYEIKEILLSDYNIEVKDNKDIDMMNIMSITECFSGHDKDGDDEDEGKINVERGNEMISISENIVDDADNQYNKELINFFTSFLDEREAKIISLSYGLIDGHDYNNKEIGEMLSLHPERIRQIKRAAIKKMQEHKMEIGAI